MATQEMTARVRLTLDRDFQCVAGRYRIGPIDVELTPALPVEDIARLERCQAIFEDFCIVTESVRRGIDVQVAVVAQPAEPAVALKAS